MALAETDIAPAAEALPLDSIICGDALDMLRTLPSNSVDSIVTDPPAGIAFMGKSWDSNKGGRDAWIAWLSSIMAEALRVLKPGGHALVWALPRTSHWTGMALEDAGFEIRDCVTHLFGSGFPKSLDVAKQLDKTAGAKREVTGRTRGSGMTLQNKLQGCNPRNVTEWNTYSDKPATDAARQWDGWGTALKPASEHWILCRKPLAEPNIAANVLTWGTGALNIGASRVGSDSTVRSNNASNDGHNWRMGVRANFSGSTVGRWPANLLLSHAQDCTAGSCSLWCPVRALDAQSGIHTSTGGTGPASKRKTALHGWTPSNTGGFGDTGGASRYFQTFRYQPKASRSERNRGCEGLEVRDTSEVTGRKPGSVGLVGNPANKGQTGNPYAGESGAPRANHHPTVKPLALMSWLIGLITPPGGIVLDPFAGSGSTLVAAKAGGWHYIGIEKEAEYVAIARARLQAS